MIVTHIEKKMWTETNTEEIKALGLQICMALYPQNAMYDHWTETFIYMNTFIKVMSSSACLTNLTSGASSCLQQQT